MDAPPHGDSVDIPFEPNMRSQALYNGFHDVFLMCLVCLKNMNILHMCIFWKGPFFDSYYKYITFYHNSFLYGFPAVSVFGGSHRGAHPVNLRARARARAYSCWRGVRRRARGGGRGG